MAEKTLHEIYTNDSLDHMESSRAGLWQRLNFFLLGCLVIWVYPKSMFLDVTGIVALFLAVYPYRCTPKVLLISSLLTILIVPRHLILFRGPAIAIHIFNSHNLPTGIDGDIQFIALILLNALVLIAGLFILRALCKVVPHTLTFLIFGPAVILAWAIYSTVCWQTLKPLPSLAIGLLLCFFSHALLSLSLYIKKDGKPLSLRDILWVQPFWTLYTPSWIPQPVIPKETTEKEQQRIFLHLCLGGLALLATKVATRVLYGSSFGLEMVNYRRWGIERGLILPGHTGQLWLNVMYATVSFIVITLWIQSAVPYYFLGIIGFKIPFPIRNPFQANSFHDFFARLFVYYSRALLNLVAFPMYRLLGKWKVNQAFRKNFSVAFGVFVFAELFHMQRDPWIFVPTGDQNYFIEHLREFSVYSILLTAAVMISMWVEGNRERPPWVKWISFPVYLTIYSVILMFGTIHGESLQTKWALIRHLFFLES